MSRRRRSGLRRDDRPREGPLALHDIETLTLFVEDLPAAQRFYEQVFDTQLLVQDEESAVYRIGTLQVNLLQAAAAAELVGPGEVGPPGPHRFVLTVLVSEVDAVCAQLAELGVPLRNGPVDRPWGRRTAAFADPAGHLWEIAAPLP